VDDDTELDSSDTGKVFGIKSPKELTFTNYDKVRPFELELTGHGVQATFPGDPMTVAGSAVPGNTYRLLQVHWHWASESSQGSEHYIDGDK
jgi:carbonic anhydrase